MRVALFISGSGSTAEAVITACQNGSLKNLVIPDLVIASKSGVAGIEKAKTLGVPVEIIEREKFPTQEKFGEKIISILSQYDIELISQNGWLPLTPKNVLEKFPNRVINQHPGPLDPGRPDFGGKGMFGARVTCARIIYCYVTEDEFPTTESTIHFVTEEFDKGNIINISVLPFSKLDRKITLEQIESHPVVREFIVKTTQRIQKELLELEHANVIKTLKQFAIGEVNHFEREEQLIPQKNLEILYAAKKLAIKLFPEKIKNSQNFIK